MDEMQAFYDAAFPRLEEILTYLDRLDLGALPPDAEQLLLLCYSLFNISFPVEVWRQARVPDSGAASLDAVIEPAVLALSTVRRVTRSGPNGGKAGRPCGSA